MQDVHEICLALVLIRHDGRVSSPHDCSRQKAAAWLPDGEHGFGLFVNKDVANKSVNGIFHLIAYR